MVTEAGVTSHAALRPRRDSATRLLQPRSTVQQPAARIHLRRAAVDTPSSSRCTRFADCDVDAELNLVMPPRPRLCADRPPTTFRDACGSIVAAAGSCALRGCMGARAAQALGLRLLRHVLCGATSSEHIPRVTTVESQPDSNAVTRHAPRAATSAALCGESRGGACKVHPCQYST